MPDPIQSPPCARPHEPIADAAPPETPRAGALIVAGEAQQIAWLPRDVLLHIGQFLPDRSLLDFAGSCRTNWRAMQQEASWRRTLGLVGRAGNLAQLDEALQAAAACPPRRHAEALGRLAKRLARMPSYQACDAIRAQLACGASLPPVDQARIGIKQLFGLSEAISGYTLVLDEDDHALESVRAEIEGSTGAVLASLSAGQQATLLPRFLRLAKALPPEQRSLPYWLDRVSAFGPRDAARTLAAATRWLIPLDDIARGKMTIAKLIQAAAALRDERGQAVPEQSALLYELIQHLYDIRGQFDRYPLWQRLLDATLLLPPDRRAVLLCELAPILSACSNGSARHLQSGWQGLCDAVDALPRPHRIPVIGTLTGALAHAPWIAPMPPEQPVRDAVVAQNCHRLLDYAEALDEAERRTIRLTMLNMLRVRCESFAAIPTVPEALKSVLTRIVSSGPRA